ncbi:MAG: Re/Si-specific NAD(P)(+) transhydrogenase subunit alpha [Candidatus Hydrogenedentota bacterium]
MIIGIPRESTTGEARVGIAPETVAKLSKKGHKFVVEPGAGVLASFTDEQYRNAGAEEGDAWAAELVVKVRPPSDSEVARVKSGAVLISFLYPLLQHDLVRALAARKATAISVDMIPRTTLAQSMDALSSQANLAGYKAVLMAAERLPKFFPMLMTAAGTIPPAKVLILGAGVAGLQAIATARRLGAVVEVFDVRAVVKEQVESLGGKFIAVEAAEDGAGSGGYAKETSEDYQKKQKALIAAHIAKSDVVVTTALIPGKKAPTLITGDMVRAMQPGSVIVDLAAEQGGNCEWTKPGEEVIADDVTIIGHMNIPSTMALHASLLYSRNMEKLLTHLLTKEGAWKWDLAEEIAAGCVIVKDGEIVNAKVREALGAK